MNQYLLLAIVLAYFGLLLGIAMYTSRGATNESFFIGNRNSKWWLVAFGMIGTSLSGVTFVSVPGTVGFHQAGAAPVFNGLGYFQMVLGFFLGYFVVAYVLLPLYYRLGLTSIYRYLKERFGEVAYKTGATFFILSRTIGATARLYLVINVLQIFILERMGVPFPVTTLIIIAMILLYTFKGGVKTIVYTDTLQTACMLIGLVACAAYLLGELDLGAGTALQAMGERGFTDMFNTDPMSKGYFLKQILGGAFITISMTGLDQEMMQKNISVKKLGDSQKNMLTFSTIMLMVNFLFLVLGGALYLYALSKGAAYEQVAGADGAMKWTFMFDGQDVMGDNLFPTIALTYLPPALAVVFIIGLVSALFPSADGALTALTSSTCIDILGFKRPVPKGADNADLSNDNNIIMTAEEVRLAEEKQTRIRQRVHLSFAAIFVIFILGFKLINNKSIVYIIMDVAGYTYGPLLGLFAFGMLSKRSVPNTAVVPAICVLAPVACFLLSKYSAQLLGGYAIGIELLIINAGLVFVGLLAVSKPAGAISNKE